MLMKKYTSWRLGHFLEDARIRGSSKCFSEKGVCNSEHYAIDDAFGGKERSLSCTRTRVTARRSMALGLYEKWL